MNRVSTTRYNRASRFLISLMVAGSFAVGTMVTGVVTTTQAQAQQKVKRKFGPGQNALPKGVRPQVRGPAQARQAQRRPQPTPAEVMSKHGKWIVQCDAKKPTVAGAPAKKRDCGVIQIVVNKKNKRIGVTLILARVTQGKETATMMRILAPIGVYLPTGVALEVDGAAAGRVPFSRCDPRNCVAFAQMRKETLAKMKKGSKGKFLIYEAPGIGIPLDLDLSGFTAALKALDKVQK